MWSVKNQSKITVGIMKIGSEQAEESIRETCGMVITYQNEICDARYSKACGGTHRRVRHGLDDNLMMLRKQKHACA